MFRLAQIATVSHLFDISTCFQIGGSDGASIFGGLRRSQPEVRGVPGPTAAGQHVPVQTDKLSDNIEPACVCLMPIARFNVLFRYDH